MFSSHVEGVFLPLAIYCLLVTLQLFRHILSPKKKPCQFCYMIFNFLYFFKPCSIFFRFLLYFIQLSSCFVCFCSVFLVAGWQWAKCSKCCVGYIHVSLWCSLNNCASFILHANSALAWVSGS